MADVLVKFTEPVRASDGSLYEAQACGDVAEDGLWQGWIQFTKQGTADSVRTARETEQANPADLNYWAQGLTLVYLEGALARALGGPVVQPQTTVTARPTIDGPAGQPTPFPVIGARPVLNPFLVYAEGEDLLRQQLKALSRDQLANIVRWFNLPVAVDLDTSTPAAIADDMTRSIRDARRPQRGRQQERRAG